MSATTARRTSDEIARIAAWLSDPAGPPPPGCTSRADAERLLGEWTASLPEPSHRTGPAANC